MKSERVFAGQITALCLKNIYIRIRYTKSLVFHFASPILIVLFAFLIQDSVGNDNEDRYAAPYIYVGSGPSIAEIVYRNPLDAALGDAGYRGYNETGAGFLSHVPKLWWTWVPPFRELGLLDKTPPDVERTSPFFTKLNYDTYEDVVTEANGTWADLTLLGWRDSGMSFELVKPPNVTVRFDHLYEDSQISSAIRLLMSGLLDYGNPDQYFEYTEYIMLSQGNKQLLDYNGSDTWFALCLAMLLCFALPVLVYMPAYEKEHGLTDMLITSGVYRSAEVLSSVIFAALWFFGQLLMLFGIALWCKMRIISLVSFWCHALILLAWFWLIDGLSLLVSMVAKSSRQAVVILYVTVFLVFPINAILSLVYPSSGDFPWQWHLVPIMLPGRLYYLIGDSLSTDSPIDGALKLLDDDEGRNVFLAIVAFAVVCWVIILAQKGVLREVTLKTRRKWEKTPRMERVSTMQGVLEMANSASRAENVEALSTVEQEIANANDPFHDASVKIRNVRKTFRSKRAPGGKVKALRGISAVLHDQELFVLLGPNGAGKTTLIHILAGLIKQDSGEIVFHSDAPQSARVSLCPQFDKLWADMSVEKHVTMYARIRGVPEKGVKSACRKTLKQLDLLPSKAKYSGSLSGGLRRRLSVACALVGEPSLVLLDEPTTGLDPATRRQLQDILLSLKGKMSIMETTHSIEEADRMATRVCIMSRGLPIALGTPQYMKTEFGSGYKLTVACDIGSEDRVGSFVSDTFPGSALVDKVAGILTYRLPADVALSKVFGTIDSSKMTIGIRDWGVSQSSLEEVFLSLVEQDLDQQPAAKADA